MQRHSQPGAALARDSFAERIACGHAQTQKLRRLTSHAHCHPSDGVSAFVRPLGFRSAAPGKSFYAWASRLSCEAVRALFSPGRHHGARLAQKAPLPSRAKGRPTERLRMAP